MPVAESSTAFAFDQYHNFTDIQAYLSTLPAQYPNLVTLTSIGKSFENRDLWMLKVVNNQ